MSQFLAQAKHLTSNLEDKQYVMDVLHDNTYTTYLINGESIVKKLWSTPIRIDPPIKLKDQLLTIYKLMYTKDFDEINLGARVYLKKSEQHYLYRGTCRKDRSENVLEFHVERCDDIKCIWVNRNELDFWCKPIYAHCWYNDQRVELYHAFGKKLYEFSVLGEKQTLVVGSFYYNVGEFIQLIEEAPRAMVDKNVKTVIVNLNKPIQEPAKKKQKTGSLTINTVIAKPLVIVKERVEQVQVPESPAVFTESMMITALLEKRINFKHVIPLICGDEDLMRFLIHTIALVDQKSVDEILKIHQCRKEKPLSSEVDSEILHCAAQSILSREVDFCKVFFTLLDLDNSLELCKQIVTHLGRLEGFESTLCLENHKIIIDTDYSEMNKIFTNCVRRILAFEDRMVDDDNSRVKSFGVLFSLSEELTSRIIEDRNVCSHSQFKRHRLKGALDDRIQCLKQVKSALSKKKSSKKVQAINIVLQTALDQLSKPKC